MHARKECLECLKNLSIQTINLAISANPKLLIKKKYMKQHVLKLLKKQFNTKQVPAAIFTILNRRIKKLTGISDAFKYRKCLEIEAARKIYPKLLKKYSNRLDSLLLLSAAGNSLDFFREIDQSVKNMQSKVYFTIDQKKIFKKLLKNAKLILFFADNAGELFFDFPLINRLKNQVDIYYVVKSSPIQNDLTLLDLKKNIHKNSCLFVLPSGNDAVGIELSTLSQNIRRKLNECDIIIAKGMGYYETFTELPQFKEKVFHLLMAKCNPVATSLGVKLNSYVFTRC